MWYIGGVSTSATSHINYIVYYKALGGPVILIILSKTTTGSLIMIKSSLVKLLVPLKSGREDFIRIRLYI